MSGVLAAMPSRLLFLCLALASALVAAGPPTARAAADFTPAQRDAIEGIIRDYLTHNPDVLIEALRGAEDKLNREADAKAEKVLAQRRSEVLDDPATPVGGNPRGDVTIVEFFDYRCPYCKQVEPAIEALLGEDRKLRYVYKEFPVLGPDSLMASRAALAARKQGKYDAFHKELMALKGQINEAAVYKVAASVGLDADRLKRDMASPEVARMLKDNMNLAEALQIHGTPAFVIGSEIVPGAIDLGTLKEMIADTRQQK
jgi:protein-disulfide isomerase